MSSASAYLQALHDAQSRGDVDFARRLASEAANDTFDDSSAPARVDSSREDVAILMTAIAFTFAIRGRAVPEWAKIARRRHPVYLAPDEILDDEWRRQIRAETPEFFASKNIWLTTRDLQIA
ncbi:hypothetical protein A9Z40_15975 [Microbacterium arborescens]|uniref:Uncharacterized protein n=1 Tax=Microbacterium arborescens TaxID=33883 RepID=A0ABX2WJ88_9MICO|nr:hypothetical protein [Microbacterium arborescens]OAZ41707.1 hypothetical protein A9Z40_15975 [Microbacterium arborescens]